jgi:hypothetical protein
MLIYFLEIFKGTDLSARLKKIAEALDVYRNACDNYAAYFMK